MAKGIIRKNNNGNSFHEGELIGKLVTINEDIRDYNKRQIEITQRLLERMESHDTYVKSEMRSMKDDYSSKLNNIVFILKWIIIPLVIGLVGVKILEYYKVIL